MSEPLPSLALSVRQPWAWAIIQAGKRLENRTAHAIRMGGMKPGRICIHASKGMTRDEYESAAESIAFNSVGKHACPRPDELVRGAIIGVVTVTGFITKSHDRWFCGPKALVLEEPEACEPIPVAGALGYFDWRTMRAAASIEPPKPWMISWPAQPTRNATPRSSATGALFGDTP